MNPERWQKIERLFHEALACEPADRTAFLAEACGADASLRQAIDSLLAHHEQSESFIELPAFAEPGALDGEERESWLGRTIGHYQIIEALGEGGMGEVYLAQDEKLGRKVALKFLPSFYTKDRDRLRRFTQEARAVSALNHPNIITIYEVGETNDHQFIATEFIEGETLRERLSRAPMKLGEALDVSIQVASALAAAHVVGIVHRDIKPDNIMLRRDEIVKVLDFGLAKLSEPPAAVDTQAGTKPLVRTDAGTVMGTVNYMSPEQARGLAVDARTDIWSLGVVLYEMVAGKSPFTGETATDTLSMILNREPPSLLLYSADLPAEIERIVEKALSKGREERYQSAKDLLIDLRRLKKRLEVEAELERAVPRDEFGAPSQGRLLSDSRSLPPEVSTSNAGPTSSADVLMSEIKRHKTGIIVALTGLALIFAFGLFRLYKFVVQKPSDRAATQTAKSTAPVIRRLTASGTIERAAISPDGKSVVYVEKDGTQQSLWMSLIAENSKTPIVAPADVNYDSPTFSPDGIDVYYSVHDKNNPNGVLYRVPMFGGARKKTLVNIAGPIAFSPDGSHFVFYRNDQSSSGEDQLMIADANGTVQRKLAARKADTWFASRPAWSPDGRVIACPAGSYSGGRHMSVVAVEVETGEQKEFTTQRWSDVAGVAWLSDGSGLVIRATDQGSIFHQIWQLSYPHGEARKVITDLNDYYSGPSLTADSKAFVAVMADWTSNIWIAPNGDVSRAQQITLGKLEGGAPLVDSESTEAGLAWTPDGRIVYPSLASGNLNIWIMNRDGTEPKRLTANPSTDSMPAVSPDGRYIVFVSDWAGFPSLWRMDLDGGNLKQLTEKEEDLDPQISPDSHWIVFSSYRSGREALWKMPIEGGAPVLLSNEFAHDDPAISPDGKLVAALHRDEQPDSPWQIMVIPFEGGPIVKTFELPPTVDTSAGVRWTPDGRAITYIDTRGTPNLWSQPLDGGPAKQLTDFKANGVWQCSWSRDGKWLALVRGTVTKDVVLIKDFR
jgi:serine/threonine protein kinase/WD40 repeat protein